MSTEKSTTQNYEWIIHLPIHVANPVPKEKAIEHRKRCNQEVDFWLCEGLVLEEPAASVPGARIKRSHMIVSAPSKEAVFARLRDDIFYPSQWDVDNAEIEPFISVSRKPLGDSTQK
ncbi:hypothetical protein COCC4DRAFT_23558 [Bipolaris maydis ATCC 48331]|uniref:YCII-related domain-containing protein n=2 Tax=Cochliobolus heterostrophus TaxID=5016 RepID=M2SV27_COCH5|nr:uncharacterized protein COCC4DRAFT_23558 [Bipolaris maydis ATCC 48331]EMD89215.1 hypothetical protein COCHEDRAFT_1215970 [Bipolaris maydis C5]KAJ5024872.1 hypothetical protein J3E73DRAFT_397598 [Bipolaris maydis]ENI05068.1 hypothetical protein COCC4DRAFT_23558 [Bipolaris maydis ATCC 48331]KAJ6212575.1 hypothetical protein PSV09DRAFT_1215970 [Bipolaris maydis]KAJ6266131.1 hypothetical protein PSV08DRAFT_381820 [Bipolaris maydis]